MQASAEEGRRRGRQRKFYLDQTTSKKKDKDDLAGPPDPALFNLFSEFLSQEVLEEKIGISLNGENITNVRFPDDTVIMAETPEILQQMLDSIANSCKTYGMEMNAKKDKNYA
ncbi:endonuclease-reverse transcriptase [Elysia marginata]|uniref:Endonuclease-reverse transcriptase n=1 Tax=Elysia marginata TaxID=1093978 RepID=A0AAV4EZ96_9GAST|nr:endonuclease-reverse transcriptase [Elysia marginata]